MRYREILEACWNGYRRKPGTAEYSPGSCEKISEADIEENLRKWFKEKWVRFGPDGKIRGACARGDDSEGKPKCLPQAKAHALGKKGRASAAARKRRQDPNPERRGPAKNVATKEAANPAQQAAIAIAMKQGVAEGPSEVMGLAKFAKGGGILGGQSPADIVDARGIIEEKCPECGGPMFSELLINEKKDACYYKVKSRYKVWPSAYASGALVQCRKKGAANWGNKSKNEDVAEGATPASTSKVLRLIQRHRPDWFDNYGMGEVEDTVVDMAEMGKFQGMSAVDALALVGQELESLYGQQGVAEGIFGSKRPQEEYDIYLKGYDPHAVKKYLLSKFGSKGWRVFAANDGSGTVSAHINTDLYPSEIEAKVDLQKNCRQQGVTEDISRIQNLAGLK